MKGRGSRTKYKGGKGESAEEGEIARVNGRVFYYFGVHTYRVGGWRNWFREEVGGG